MSNISSSIRASAKGCVRGYRRICEKTTMSISTEKKRALPDRIRDRDPILLAAYIGISFVGLLVLVVATFNPGIGVQRIPHQRQLTGTLYSAVCVVGILAGGLPSKCTRALHIGTASPSEQAAKGSVGEVTLRGHHPTCGCYASHVIRLGGKVFCGGCTGLVIGAVLALIGATYFFIDVSVKASSGVLFWMGVIAVIAGLLQHFPFHVPNSVVHVLVNVAFVVGTLLLLIGSSEIHGGFVLQVYLLAVIVFWVLTRIVSSRVEHTRMCRVCGRNCDIFARRR